MPDPEQWEEQFDGSLMRRFGDYLLRVRESVMARWTFEIILRGVLVKIGDAKNREEAQREAERQVSGSVKN